MTSYRPGSGPNSPRREGLLSPRFAYVLVLQTVFGFAWSLYLVQPKFLSAVLGASAGAIGAVSATGGFAAASAIPFVARTIDRSRRRTLFLAGSLVLLLVSLGYGRVHAFGPLVYLLQAGIGMSFVCSFNATLALTADVAPRDRLGQAFGIQGAANLSMNAVGSAVAEHVADHYGWQWVFALGGAVALLAILLGLGFREERPHRAASSDVLTAPYWALARAFLVVALAGSAFNAMFTFMQPFALARGATRVSPFFIGFTVTALVMRVPFGNIGDRFGLRPVCLASLAIYAIVPFSMIFFEPRFLFLYGAGLGAAHGIFYPTVNAYSAERVPREVRGRILAVQNGAFNAGSAFGATLWGAVAGRTGYPAVFAIASAVAAAALALFSTSRDVPPIP